MWWLLHKEEPLFFPAMATRRLFNYLGTKRAISPLVNRMCSSFHDAKWIEPFCGSASLFYNLDFKPDGARLNDVNSNVMLMHRACRDYGYGDYIGVVHEVNTRFGDCRNSKDSYYAYRNWYNEHGVNDARAGLHLVYLASMCINSMLRFGPNGMNQSYGNRSNVIGEDDWNEMHSLLADAMLTCCDYKDIPIDGKCVVFLDPPYEEQSNDLYGRGFSQDEFLTWLKAQVRLHDDCLWMYTDVESDKADSLLNEGFRKIQLRDMVTVAPSKAKGDVTSTEDMYVFGDCMDVVESEQMSLF